jgi:hypothetical protein
MQSTSRLSNERSLSWSLFQRVVGDRTGAVIFFGSICFVGLYWQRGIFINDNYTFVNALLNLAEGRLHFESFYGADFVSWPGTTEIDGRSYGRSYGIVFAALPFLWVITPLGTVVGYHLVAVFFWCLSLLGFSFYAGKLTGEQGLAALGGGSVAVVILGSNILFASPVPSEYRYVLALQMLAIVTTGLVGVVLYRLVKFLESKRMAIFAGSAVVLASSVGYWGSIPKRHVFVALLTLVSIYGFAVSRNPSSPRHERFHRSLSYAAVGLTAWINPGEAAVLFTVLLPLDLLTAHSNDWRHLATIGSAFIFSLIPFLVTNTIVTGEPLTSSRMTSMGLAEPDGGTGGSTGGSSGGSNGGALPVPGILGSVIDSVGLVASFYTDGFDTISAEPGRIYEVFINRGYDRPNVGGPQNLSIIESMPFLAALVGLFPLAVRKLRERDSIGTWIKTTAGRTDVFATSYVLLFTLLYMPRLPLRVQLTVRYLVPIVPLLVLLVFRLSLVQRILRTHQTDVLWTYAFTVGGLSAVFIALLNLGQAVGLPHTPGRIISLHGEVALVCGLCIGAGILLASVFEDSRLDGGMARLLAFGAGMSTVLILVSFVHYWSGDLMLIPSL